MSLRKCPTLHWGLWRFQQFRGIPLTHAPTQQAPHCSQMSLLPQPWSCTQNFLTQPPNCPCAMGTLRACPLPIILQVLSILAHHHTATEGWPFIITGPELTEDQGVLSVPPVKSSLCCLNTSCQMFCICLLDTIPLNTAQLPDYFTGDNHVIMASEMIQSNLIVNSGLKILEIIQQIFIEPPKKEPKCKGSFLFPSESQNFSCLETLRWSDVGGGGHFPTRREVQWSPRVQLGRNESPPPPLSFAETAELSRLPSRADRTAGLRV